MNTIESIIIKSNKVEVIKCMRSQEVNMEIASMKHLQKKNRHLLQMYKLLKEETSNKDMRMYMVVK